MMAMLNNNDNSVPFRFLTKRSFKYSPKTSFREKLQNFLAKDSKNALKIRALDLIVKTASLSLYIIQTFLYDLADKSNTPVHYNDSLAFNETTIEDSVHLIGGIEWRNILFIKRFSIFSYIQLVFSFHGIADLILFLYLYNDDLLRKLDYSHFIIGFLTSVPWFAVVFIPYFRNVFIPMFLIIWLIKRDVKLIFQNYNILNAKVITGHKIHQSIIRQELILLLASLVSFIITSTFGFFHLQQGSPNKKIALFDSFYYTIITFSTVGYGDIHPDLWISKLFMSLIIMVALVIIPKQIEHVVRLLVQQRSLGDSYNINFMSDKHIVVCSGNLQYDLIYHFLKEFYKNRKNLHTKTILFSTSELDKHLSSMLSTPLWKQRVFYIYGSVLRFDDMERAKIKTAKAVFLMSSRGIIEKDLSDQQAILRSWSIKRYASKIPQYIQLYRPENKIHVNFAEHLICEDELKYALLATNCAIPGTSGMLR